MLLPGVLPGLLRDIMQVVLKAIMLRRTKNTILNGKPLIQLPDRKVVIIQCMFDDDEREFYSSLENKTTEIFERMAKRDEVMKNLTSVLVLLLRLRQGETLTLLLFMSFYFVYAACDHPALIVKDYRKDADALEPARADEDGADELVGMFSGLNVNNTVKCSICQTL